MSRLQDPRQQLEWEDNTRDMLLSFCIFRNNVPWWDPGYRPGKKGRYRHCVQRVFWNTDSNWREPVSLVLKRRGAVFLLEIGKQQKLALAFLVNNLGFYEQPDRSVKHYVFCESDETLITDLHVPLEGAEGFMDNLDWRRE